jgi:hypothetical protein
VSSSSSPIKLQSLIGRAEFETKSSTAKHGADSPRSTLENNEGETTREGMAFFTGIAHKLKKQVSQGQQVTTQTISTILRKAFFQKMLSFSFWNAATKFPT